MSYFKIVKVLFSFLAPCPPLNHEWRGETASRPTDSRARAEG
jgi:hypothetical protein